MRAVTALINPFKADLKPVYLFLPSINFGCFESMKSWLELRVLTQDMGRKFLVRIFLYESVILGVYLFYTVIFLLNFFEIFNYQFHPMVNAFALFDIGLVLTTVFAMVVFGAITNKQFDYQINNMRNLKGHLLNFKMNIKDFLDPN